jgi:hypothetical protein
MVFLRVFKPALEKDLEPLVDNPKADALESSTELKKQVWASSNVTAFIPNRS